MFKPSEKNFGLPKSLIDSVATVLAEKAPPFTKKDDKKVPFGKKKDDKGDSDKKPAFGKKDDDSDEDDKKPAFGNKKADGDEDSDEDDSDKKAASGKKSDDDGDEDDDEEMIGKDGKKTKVDLKPKLNIKEAAFTDKEISRIEAIMEVSNKTLRSYAVKSDRHLMDIKPAWIRHADYAKGAAVGAHGKTAQKRAQGGELAIKKIRSNITKTNATTQAGAIASQKGVTESKQFDKGDEPDDHKYDSSKDKSPEHIIMQLRKAKSLGSDNKHIEFNNGQKVKVNSAHVHKALDMHASFKRAPEKDDFTKQISKSHDHLVRAVTGK